MPPAVMANWTMVDASSSTWDMMLCRQDDPTDRFLLGTWHPQLLPTMMFNYLNAEAVSPCRRVASTQYEQILSKPSSVSLWQ